MTRGLTPRTNLSMRTRLFATFLLFAALALPTRPVAAQAPRLFINTSQADLYRILRYQGRDWDVMTSLLNGQFAITNGAALPSLDALGGFDALWVDQRYFVAPTPAEVATILGFAASGRRVVVVGENQSALDYGFMTWSVPLVHAVGGDQGAPVYAWSGPGCLYGTVNTVLSNALTTGVSTVGVGCAGFAIGGTPLFDYNVATLWGERQNILTILDANMLDDDYSRGNDGVQFQKNVSAWLSAEVVLVPEPGTLVLLLPALFGIVAVARKRAA